MQFRNIIQSYNPLNNAWDNKERVMRPRILNKKKARETRGVVRDVDYFGWLKNNLSITFFQLMNNLFKSIAVYLYSLFGRCCELFARYSKGVG